MKFDQPATQNPIELEGTFPLPEVMRVSAIPTRPSFTLIPRQKVMLTSSQ